jgi:hypothetical protein
MKIEEPYFVATENPSSFELEAIFWAKTMLEAVDEAERRKRMFPTDVVIIARKMRIYEKPLKNNPIKEQKGGK